MADGVPAIDLDWCNMVPGAGDLDRM